MFGRSKRGPLGKSIFFILYFYGKSNFQSKIREIQYLFNLGQKKERVFLTIFGVKLPITLKSN